MGQANRLWLMGQSKDLKTYRPKEEDTCLMWVKQMGFRLMGLNQRYHPKAYGPKDSRSDPKTFGSKKIT